MRRRGVRGNEREREREREGRRRRRRKEACRRRGGNAMGKKERRIGKDRERRDK